MNSETRNFSKPIIAMIFFLIVVPFIAHILFSSLGYNPTDDGFTLAYSKRILEGQVPHRDFIIIRPFLSPVMHLPFVIFGGDYTYWFSRFFVWFQLSCIAWIWTSLVDKLLKQSFGIFEKTLIALIAFSTSTHNHQIMAWHTIDGLFFISIGLAVCTTSKPAGRLVGYILISLAYLCKQSFIFTAPLILVVLGDWRKVKYWLAIMIPGILYIFFLLFSNAFHDAFLQLTSHKGLLRFGLKAYLNRELLLGILVGYFSIRMAFGDLKARLKISASSQVWFGVLLLTIAPLFGVAITFISGKFIGESSYGLFGLIVGSTFYFFVDNTEKPIEQIRVGLLVLITAWSASISIGYNFPVLVSGQMIIVLLAYAYPIVLRLTSKKVFDLSLMVCTVIILLSFGVVRTSHICRDQSARNLTRALDEVLPGGKLIKTNNNTYEFLADLRNAIDVALASNKTYAIIPECPGYWVQSPQTNPLSIDWVQGIELNKQVLVNRILVDLESRRDTNIVIVQKIQAALLEKGFIPLFKGYKVVKYVHEHFTKIYETSFFELYE